MRLLRLARPHVVARLARPISSNFDSNASEILSRLRTGNPKSSTGPTESEKNDARKRYEAQCEIKYGKKKWEQMKAAEEAKNKKN